MADLTKISYAKAQSVLSKYRYKARNEWSSDERALFKICNFAVLSKKRLNKILEAFRSLSKLSDKSHYNYNDLDIKLIKELILENLEVCFKKFNKKLNIIKETDLQKIQDHLSKLKEENLRLENENKRLRFVIENHIRENQINKIEDVRELLKINITSENKSKKKKSILTEKLAFDEKSIKEFVKKWDAGYTTFEIRKEFEKTAMNMKDARKKKGFKL
jgi:hypothetical protein